MLHFVNTLLIPFLLIGNPVTVPANTPLPAKAAVIEEAPVKWLTIEQAEAAAKKKPKKIFVDVYTDWCGWCKRMDKTTFADPKVAKYLNDNFYAVKLNAEKQDNIIFNGQVYGFKAEVGTHSLPFAWLGGRRESLSYPTTVYLDEKLNLISPVPGYLDAKDFVKLLHYMHEGGYKKGDYETWAKSYKAE